MKNIFYALVNGLIISFILYALETDVVYELPPEINGLVIDKNHSQILGDIITILMPDSTTSTFVCYDILYDQVSTGDSIIDGKIIKIK
jgi:hypothetical protein